MRTEEESRGERTESEEIDRRLLVRTGRSSTKPSGLKGDRPILTVGNNGTGVSPAAGATSSLLLHPSSLLFPPPSLSLSLLCGVGSSGDYLPYECTVFYIFLGSGSVG